jgi:peroxiredoxin
VIDEFSDKMKRGAPAVIFISINLACLWVYYHYSRQQGSEPTEPPLAYGTSATPLMKLIAPHVRSASENRWRLILYFGDYGRAIPNVKYAQILFDRFHNQGFNVVGVVAGMFPEVEKLVERQLISYPVVHDLDWTIAHSLRILPEGNACFFVDPDNTIRFSTTNLFDPEDLRQLAEKFLLGDVAYPERNPVTLLSEGGPLPEFTLLTIADLKPWQWSQVKGQEQVVIVFTAACPSCRLTSYLSEYDRIQDQLPQRPLVIFSQNFSQGEILLEANRRDIDTSNFYLASGALAGIEDPYYGAELHKSDVLVIETDRAGKIKQIESWEELTARLEGGRSQ